MISHAFNRQLLQNNFLRAHGVCNQCTCSDLTLSFSFWSILTINRSRIVLKMTVFWHLALDVMLYFAHEICFVWALICYYFWALSSNVPCPYLPNYIEHEKLGSWTNV